MDGHACGDPAPDRPAGGRRIARLTSCAVLVTDGSTLLVGQGPFSPRWDIPKGVAEPGEGWPDAAVRELREETALVAAPEALVDLGLHRYLPGKDLALFAWRPHAMPEPSTLRCASMFRHRDGRLLPEFVRFAVLHWDDAVGRVGKNMARVLGHISPGNLFS